MAVPLLRKAAIGAGSSFLNLVLRSYAATIKQHRHNMTPLADRLVEGPVIYAFYHCHILLMPFSIPHPSPFRPVHVMISPSDDGTLVTKAVEKLGVIGVRGSSSREGTKARLGLLEALQQGHNVGITPDGPRGPARTVKPGAAWLARESGCPIVGLSWTASRFHRLNSWDRFMVPLPGSRVHFYFGNPLFLDSEESFASSTSKLQKYMDDQVRANDSFLNSIPSKTAN